MNYTQDAGDLSGTRTSDRWSTQPGRMDPLNLAIVWRDTAKYGLPFLDQCLVVPELLVPWHSRRSPVDAAQKPALHFFLDDYRFETVWAKPAKALERVQTVGTALTPDFSMWRDMPMAAQLWQVYRSRWCGAYWQNNGVNVIPSVTWGYPDTYDFAFAGLPTGSVVAVSSVGTTRDPEAREVFRLGVLELVERLTPYLILSYGPMQVDVPVMVREYPTFWSQRRER